MKKWIAMVLILALTLAGCAQGGGETDPPETTWDASQPSPDYTHISLDGDTVYVEEGTGVYTANDIIYYEAGHDFAYGEGTQEEAHEAQEAAAHTVVHITQPGTYRITGKLDLGQIAVDLGADAKDDPNAVVTLILDGADITCTVAPAVIFYNVYECGSTDLETASATVDTSAAGANVVLADGSVNRISGSYVAEIYVPDTVVLNEDGTEVAQAERLHKYDGAFYSRMSMNVTGGIAGDGVLEIQAENEGLDSELHLTINGGDIRIASGNDGINTNADGLSVTTVNAGTLTIQVMGETGEGDGIDSNGYLVLNGGRVYAYAWGESMDAGVDADLGIHINGGELVASGNMLDAIAESAATYVCLQFRQSQPGGTTYQLKNEAGEVVLEVSPANAFTQLVLVSERLMPGTYSLWQGEIQLEGAPGNLGMPGDVPGRIDIEPPEGDFQIPTPPTGEVGTMGTGNPGGPRPQDGTEAEPPEGMGQIPPEGMETWPGEERPEGMQEFQSPDGAVPTMPEGMEALNPEGQNPGGNFQEFPAPDGAGGYTGGELSVEFVIVQGGNQFVNVAPAE